MTNTDLQKHCGFLIGLSFFNKLGTEIESKAYNSSLTEGSHQGTRLSLSSTSTTASDHTLTMFLPKGRVRGEFLSKL